ncbi:hypothetical protein [Treponema saccharophilum]|uniref:Uncharacterized protein n=1 Tax=Treponema saccharophilum DSM 2985 TaxID=907348 RepID=H7ELP5_9SPIR|nr:hypothetical protein [Treponema saccharophilum]EIC01586.1 hypothetical protein TresaDRAFT_1195 [Treponema saccharophilum DSM 2985]BDC95508.1 hypothetical protein TRSA_06070 [Treponema saccharophilum]
MNDKLIIKLPYGEVNAEWYDWLGAGVLTCTLLYGASKLAKRIKKIQVNDNNVNIETCERE